MNTESIESGYAKGLQDGLIKRLRPEVERALKRAGVETQSFSDDLLRVRLTEDRTIQVRKSSPNRLLREYRIFDKKTNKPLSSFRLPEMTKVEAG